MVVSLVIAAGTAVACSGHDSQDATVPTFGTAVAPDVTALTGDTSNPLAFPAYSDPDTPIYMAVGRRFAVMLEANPSTGYRWEAVSPPDSNVVAPLGTQFLTTNTALLGAPDSEILSYVATGVGVTDINLRYGPAAGGPSADTRTVTFHVTVTLDGLPPPTTTTTTLPGSPGVSSTSSTVARSTTTTTAARSSTTTTRAR